MNKVEILHFLNQTLLFLIIQLGKTQTLKYSLSQHRMIKKRRALKKMERRIILRQILKGRTRHKKRLSRNLK